MSKTENICSQTIAEVEQRRTWPADNPGGRKEDIVSLIRNEKGISTMHQEMAGQLKFF